MEREREILKQVSFVGVERWRGRGKYLNRLVLWEWSGEVEREREILKQVSVVGVEWSGEGEGNTKTG